MMELFSLGGFEKQKQHRESLILLDCQKHDLSGIDQFQSLGVLHISTLVDWDTIEGVVFPKCLESLILYVKVLDAKLLPPNLQSIVIRSDTSFNLIHASDMPRSLKTFHVHCKRLIWNPVCLPKSLESFYLAGARNKFKFGYFPTSLKILACKDCSRMETIDTQALPRGLRYLALICCNQGLTFEPRCLPPGLFHLNLQGNTNLPQFPPRYLNKGLISLQNGIYECSSNPLLVRVLLLKESAPEELDYFPRLTSVFYKSLHAATRFYGDIDGEEKMKIRANIKIPLLQAVMVLLLSSPSSLSRLPRELIMYLKCFVY